MNSTQQLQVKIYPPTYTDDELDFFAGEVRFLTDGTRLWDGTKIDIEWILESTAHEMGWIIEHQFHPLMSTQKCESKTYGYCLFQEKTIVLDSRDDVVATPTQRFTQAHELFHMLKHEQYALQTSGKVLPEKLEKNANSFARRLLLPKEEFTQAFKEECIHEGLKDLSVIDSRKAYKLETVLSHLAYRFCVSGWSAAVRVKDLNLTGDKRTYELNFLSKKTYIIGKKK